MYQIIVHFKPKNTPFEKDNEGLLEWTFSIITLKWYNDQIE